jgi:hypothetical protein
VMAMLLAVALARLVSLRARRTPPGAEQPQPSSTPA